jgi:threonyl-tRNA synthetase
MPDCHAMCKDMEQAKEEFRKRFDLSREVIIGLGIDESDYEMAIRFTEEFYNENKSLIEETVKKNGRPVLVEMWKERFFYFVLKWEFNFVDNLGKASALSTDQIDVENGKRYNIEYIDENNKPQNPIILHNSPSGAIERVIYVLLEKAAKDIREGRKPQFPLWLAPSQVRVIPVKPEYLQYCKELAEKITGFDIRVDVDDRNESVGKSIRDAETDWIPYILVIGEKEVSAEKFSIRDRKSGSVKELSIDNLIKEIKERTKGKPLMKLNMDRNLSKRPQIMV